MTSNLLDFEKKLVTQCVTEDSLVVVAKGLIQRELLSAFLSLYKVPEALVIVLNMEESLESDIIKAWKGEQAEELGKYELEIPCLFHKLTASVSTRERASLYLKGGVFFASSRIAIIDFLRGTIPIHLITGLVICNAHMVSQTSLESFIIRLFRDENKEGFIKAFSENPEAISQGFAGLEKKLKSLFLKQVSFWPRFQVDLAEELNGAAAEVIELRVPLTRKMKEIQYAILSVIETCVKELVRLHSSLSLDDFIGSDPSASLSSGVFFAAIDVIIRRQLDHIWYSVGQRTKDLVEDLRTLRQLLGYLLSQDCVAFHAYLETLLMAHSSVERDTVWLLAKSADLIFEHAKSRMYERKKEKKPRKNHGPEGSLERFREDFDLILETSPKWHVFKDILEEIELELDNNGVDDGKILVLVDDRQTMRHYQSFIKCPKVEDYLKPSFKRHMKWKSEALARARKVIAGSNHSNGRKGDPKTDGKRRKTVEVMNYNIEDELIDLEALELVESTLSEASDDEESKIVFRLYSDYQNPDMLATINPNFVVMTSPNLTFIRQVEMYQARFREHQLVRIYFMLWEDSVEEQQYLTGIRREKESFEALIKEKSVMSVWKEQDGKQDLDHLLREYEEDGRTVGDSRLQNVVPEDDGEPHEDNINCIVVDVRELRSSLPCILHSRGMKLLPCTIEIGDYVLTPKHCVERKSISDLISSLNSGRLYTQVTAMFSHYDHVFLLIEFDPSRSIIGQSLFTGIDSSSNGLMNDYLYGKLLLLLIHFPSLRLMWSAYPTASHEYFEDVKRSQPQPKIEEAKKIEKGASDRNFSYHILPKEMLLSLDGVTSTNYTNLLEHVSTLSDLCGKTREELSLWIGAIDGENVEYADTFERPSSSRKNITELGDMQSDEEQTTGTATTPKGKKYSASQPSATSGSRRSKKNMRFSSTQIPHNEKELDSEEDILGTRHYDPNQSLSMKRHVRKTYRNMLQTLQESKIEALKPESSVLEDVIERSNDLLQEKVKNPLEALLDFRLMSAAADLGAEKLAKLPIGVQDLNVGTFMDRFLGFFHGRSDNLANDLNAMDQAEDDENDKERKRDEKAPKVDWLAFGIDFYGQVSRTCPSMGFFYGSLDKEFKERKVSMRKKRDSIGPLQKPSQMTKEQIEQQSEGDTSRHVKKLYDCIKFTPGRRVSFFKLIIDPSSFGHSVENLFYLSFLVREGKVGLEIHEENGEDELFVQIVDVSEGQETGNRMDTQQKQYVLNLSNDVWQRAILKYKITEPFSQV